MSPEQFKTARQTLGLSQSKMAEALRLSGSRSIRHYEAGHRSISGPITKLIELFLDYPDLMD